MRQGHNRGQSLNPAHFFNLVEHIKDLGWFPEEVVLRRIISGLYFSLYNYWAYKKYSRGVKGERILPRHVPYEAVLPRYTGRWER